MKHKHILMSVAMAALMLGSLCAVSASTVSVSAAQGSNYVKAPTVVGAPVGSGAPAPCSVDGTSLDLFIRGGDNYLYLKITPDGIHWPSESTSLGGSMTSSPAATVRDTNKVTVFARGSDGAVWYKDGLQTGLTTAWGNWVSIGGQIPFGTSPSVCSWGGGRLDVFARGTDGALWHKTWTDSAGWSKNWDSIGGKLTSGPGATATSDGNQIGVFVAGVNGAIFYKHYSSSSGWGSWINVGGTVTALPATIGYTSPAAYNWGSAQLGWFVVGTDSRVYGNWVNSQGGISGYVNLGGVATSSPAATAKTNGVADVFVRGSSGQFAALYQISYNYPANPNVWGVWTAIGGV
jgi:hypothetical protein